jgi:hypothetical protein
MCRSERAPDEQDLVQISRTGSQAQLSDLNDCGESRARAIGVLGLSKYVHLRLSKLEFWKRPRNRLALIP